MSLASTELKIGRPFPGRKMDLKDGLAKSNRKSFPVFEIVSIVEPGHNNFGKLAYINEHYLSCIVIKLSPGKFKVNTTEVCGSTMTKKNKKLSCQPASQRMKSKWKEELTFVS